MTVVPLALIFILAFTGTAFAQGVVAETPLGDVAKLAYDAVMSGEYFVAAAFGVVVVLAVARRYGPKLWAPLGSKVATYLMLIAISFAGSVANALAAGEAFSFELLKTAALIAAAAGGGFGAAKHLLVLPLLVPLREMLPAKFRGLLDALLWIFDRQGAAGLKAKKAAAKAAESFDAPGAAGVVGEPRDL